MSAFAQRAAARVPKPPGIVVLKPEHWAHDWEGRPAADVAVGVRPLGELDAQQAQAEAAKNARAAHPDSDAGDPLLMQAFEEQLMVLAVARAAVNPNDARDPYFPAGDEMVPAAWSPSTIRRVWDELERVTIATSPVREPANDDQLALLAQALTSGAAAKLSPSRELRLRKLLAFALEELNLVAEED